LIDEFTLNVVIAGNRAERHFQVLFLDLMEESKTGWFPRLSPMTANV
jgi:hypothetical protein